MLAADCNQTTLIIYLYLFCYVISTSTFSRPQMHAYHHTEGNTPLATLARTIPHYTFDRPCDHTRRRLHRTTPTYILCTVLPALCPPPFTVATQAYMHYQLWSSGQLLDVEFLHAYPLFSFGLLEDEGLLRCAELYATSGCGVSVGTTTS